MSLTHDSGKPRIAYTNTELAWAAGFFDGEGNIRWNDLCRRYDRRHQRGYGTLALQIGQTDRRVLDRFGAAVGVTATRGPYAKKNRHKPYFTYQINGHKAKSVFDLIRPFLSEVKREQGDAALIGWQEQQDRPRSKYDRYRGAACTNPV